MDQQIVKIELSPAGRIRLGEQIDNQMIAMGYNRHDYNSLNLAFELSGNWPEDKSSELTMHKLGFLANRLKMNLIIGDRGVDLVPMNGEHNG